MKTKKTLLSVVIFFAFIILTGYNEGGGTLTNSDGSGARGGGGCSCHDLSATPGIVAAIELYGDGVPVTEYVPRKTYIIRISATNNTTNMLPAFGFRIAVVKGENAGTTSAQNVGQLGSLPDNAVKIAVNNYYVVGQRSRIKASAGTGGPGTTYEETITWTAPDTGTGEIQIFGVMLAVDSDKTVNGDKWNKAFLIVPEHEYPAQINGNPNLCINGSTILHATKKGGNWYSSNPDKLKVEPISETDAKLTALEEGSALINYSINDQVVTVRGTSDVNPVLNPITGKDSKDFVCSGDTVQLLVNLPGGTWTIDDTEKAAITQTGKVAGLTQGKVNVTYSITNNCGTATQTKEISVRKSLVAGKIKTPKTDLCVNETVKLENGKSGGEWQSGSSLASMAQDGSVTGLYPGAVTISYTIINDQNNCKSSTTQVLNIHPQIDAGSISGNVWLKVGQSVKYTDNVPGGRWKIGDQDNINARVTSDGMVTGISEGKTTIIYNIYDDFCPASATKEITIKAK